MELGFRHLQVVLTVARHGSISAAATSLGQSQPSLSAQLSRIETEFGGPLFHRHHAGVATTPLGAVVLDRADRIVNDFQSLLTDAAARSRDTATIVVSANRTPYCTAFLTGMIRALPQRHVVPHTSTSTAVIDELLLDGEVDLAVVGIHPDVERGQEPGGRLRQQTVVEREPFLVAISAEHRLAELAQVPMSELGDEQWLLPPGRPDGTLAALLHAFHDAGIDPPSPLGRQRLTEYGPYVAAGMAVAIALPTYEPHDGVVVRPLLGTPVAGRRVLRWNPDTVTDDEARTASAVAIECFCSELERTAVQQRWWDETPEQRPVVASEARL